MVGHIKQIGSRKVNAASSQQATRQRKLRLAAAVALPVVSGLMGRAAHAANGTWQIGGTSGNWTNFTNWISSTVPGATSGTTDTDVATFNSAVGTYGTSGSPIVIDSASENIGGVSFDTAAGNYTIGATGGNSLLLTSGGTIQILSTLTATNAVETLNAPLVIEGAGGTYTFANNSANGTGAGAGTLDFGGQISGGVAGATVLTLSGSNTNNNTISGKIINGTATTVAVTKTGAGTWVLSGANTYSAATIVTGGILTLTGSNTSTANGFVDRADTNGVLNFSGGNFSGGNSPIDAGTVAGLGTINVTSGDVTPGQFLVAGITTAGAYGIWNISGGSVTPANNNGGTVGAGANTFGQVNVTGSGSYSTTGTVGIYIGESGNGTLNVSGGGSLTLTQGNGVTEGLVIGRNNGAFGVVNLGAIGAGNTNNGLITTGIVQKPGGTATGIFNFHGGTLQASTSAVTGFFTGLTGAYVYGEGGTINNNGQSITIGQALLTPAGINGNGANSSPTVTSGGSGYITAPYVAVTGAGGTGATAVATISGGAVTGITITNPGTGYIGGAVLRPDRRRRIGCDHRHGDPNHRYQRRRDLHRHRRGGHDDPHGREHVYRRNHHFGRHAGAGRQQCAGFHRRGQRQWRHA